MENRKNKKQKKFDLGIILNITSGRVLTSIDDVYDILYFLTEENLYRNQVPTALQMSQDYILSLYPELKGVGVDTVINDIEDIKKFLAEQKQIFGNELTLSPIPTKEKYEYDNNNKELKKVISKKYK